MRFYDSNFIEIGKPQKPSFMDRRQDALMDCRIHIRRCRMPYYMNWASHCSIITDHQPVDHTETLLY